jgi:hypothetical protein
MCAYINDVPFRPADPMAIKHKKKLKFFFKNVRMAKVILCA